MLFDLISIVPVDLFGKAYTLRLGIEKETRHYILIHKDGSFSFEEQPEHTAPVFTDILLTSEQVHFLIYQLWSYGIRPPVANLITDLLAQVAFTRQKPLVDIGDGERTATIKVLRQYCQLFGDNDWPDTTPINEILTSHVQTPPVQLKKLDPEVLRNYLKEYFMGLKEQGLLNERWDLEVDTGQFVLYLMRFFQL